MIRQVAVIDYIFIGRSRLRYVAPETIFNHFQHIIQLSLNLMTDGLCASFICTFRRVMHREVKQ